MGSKTSTVCHHGARGSRVVSSEITSVFDDIRLPCFGSRVQSARSGCSPCERGFSLVLRRKSPAVTSRALCRRNLRSTMRRNFFARPRTPLESSMVSYRQGPELPLRRETIYEAFAAAARKFPDRPALVARPEGGRWTYRE